MSSGHVKKNLIISRVFDAPLEQVWNAWNDPEIVKQWWGPDRFSCPQAAIDFREGGTSLVCMRSPTELGGQDSYSTWSYTTIVPYEKIEYIHNLADSKGNPIDPASAGMPEDFPQNQRHVVEFKKRTDSKTEVTVTEYEWTVGRMMELSKMGMEQCLNKMASALPV